MTTLTILVVIIETIIRIIIITHLCMILTPIILNLSIFFIITLNISLRNLSFSRLHQFPLVDYQELVIIFSSFPLFVFLVFLAFLILHFFFSFFGSPYFAFFVFLALLILRLSFFYLTFFTNEF